MGLPIPAWAAATSYLLGQYVTNGGNKYQCVQAGTSAGAGGPTGTGATIVDNTCLWDFVSSAAVTGWDVSTSVAAGSNNEIQPSAAIAVGGFGTNSQVPSSLLNYLLMQVDRLLLWLTNMLSYPLTWTGLQTFSAGIAVTGGVTADTINPSASGSLLAGGTVSFTPAAAGDYAVEVCGELATSGALSAPTLELAGVGAGNGPGVTIPNLSMDQIGAGQPSGANTQYDFSFRRVVRVLAGNTLVVSQYGGGVCAELNASIRKM